MREDATNVTWLSHFDKDPGQSQIHNWTCHFADMYFLRQNVLFCPNLLTFPHALFPKNPALVPMFALRWTIIIWINWTNSPTHIPFINMKVMQLWSHWWSKCELVPFCNMIHVSTSLWSTDRLSLSGSQLLHNLNGYNTLYPCWNCSAIRRFYCTLNHVL